MSRFAIALIALSLAAFPAEAARLIQPSASSKSVEKGVNVWRGPAKTEAAAPTIAPSRACAKATVIIRAAYRPQRRLRMHGFWSGGSFSPAYTLTTQGFYADRMAAGL